MANNHELLTALTDQGRAWYARIIGTLTTLSPTDLDTIARQAENIGRVVRTEQQRRAARRGRPAARLYRRRGETR